MKIVKQLIQSKKILKNGSLSMIGSILIRAVDLISIPIFTRILNTADYGRVSVFTTYVQIFVILLGLDFHGSVARATLEFKKEKEAFYSSTLCFTMIWTGIVTLFLNLFHGCMESLLSMSQLEFNILVVYSYALFIIQYKSAEYIFMLQYKKNIVLSMLMAWGNLGLSVIFMLTMFANNQFLGRILGAAIPTMVLALGVLLAYLKRGKNLWQWDKIKYALKFGVPLIPHNLSHLILSNSDRVMIQSMIGNSESGIYSLTYNVGLMMHVVTEGVYNVWNPMLFRNLEGNKRSQVRSQARIFLIGYTVVATGVIGLSPEIIKIISAKAYWRGIDIVMWLCLSTYFTFVYQLFVNVEFYHKKTHLISIGTIMAAVINIVLNIYGLPLFGYEFAAISTVIAYGVLVIFHCIVLNLIIKDRVIDNAFTLITALFMIGVTYGLYIVRNQILSRVLLLALFVIIEVVLFLLLLKKEKAGN